MADTNITDQLHDIFLAGVGALAIGAEKSKEVVDQLVQKGAITVEQGKKMASDLKDRTDENVAKVRDDIIEAHMKSMTKEERDRFAARIAEMAVQVDSDEALQQEEMNEVDVAATEQAD